MPSSNELLKGQNDETVGTELVMADGLKERCAESVNLKAFQQHCSEELTSPEWTVMEGKDCSG